MMKKSLHCENAEKIRDFVIFLLLKINRVYDHIYDIFKSWTNFILYKF